MRRRSSIFSFSTLRLGEIVRRLPKALAVALCALVAAELAARWAVRTKRMERDASAQGLVESYVVKLGEQKPDVWLLGNSTLEAGFDEAAFTAATNRSAVKMPIGSATARASAAMLGYYLDHAPRKPESVILLVSKDDLNRNGYRAGVSKEFEDLAAGRLFRPQRHLALYAARGSIQDKLAGPFETMAKKVSYRLTGGATTTAPSAAAVAPPDPAGASAGIAPAGIKHRHFDGRPIAPGQTDYDFYLWLLKDYQFDAGAFDQLAATSRAHGVQDVTVVITPPTDRYIQFHAEHAPAGAPYAQIRAAIADACARNGLRCIDAGEPSSDYGQFADPYHLSDEGKARFTALVCERYQKAAAVAATEGK